MTDSWQVASHMRLHYLSYDTKTNSTTQLQDKQDSLHRVVALYIRDDSAERHLSTCPGSKQDPVTGSLSLVP